MGRRITVAAVAALSSLTLGSVAARADQPANAYYKTPGRLPGRRHGDLVRHKDLEGSAAIPGAGKTQLVIYRTTDAAGRSVPASGVVALPKGRMPKGGWPVISWAHGTTGIADSCAPSHASGTPVPLITRWVKAGYAVLQTDYQGLGTAGDHQYLIGASEGHSVLDMVRAARLALPGTLASSFVISGHSQGGHAALFAAAEAPSYTPELRLRGTVAFAPASHLDEQIPLTTSLTSPNPGLTALVATIGAGLQNAYGTAALRPDSVLTPAGIGLVATAEQQCLPQVGEAATAQGLTPASLFRQGADFSTMRRLLDLQDPTNLKIRTRVLIEQGTSDTTVIPLFTDDLAKQLRGRGTPLTYNKVAGADHGAIVGGAGATDGTQYIEKVLPRG
jgi:pimeloyl-ACP methyl ester carboxylesterase